MGSANSSSVESKRKHEQQYVGEESSHIVEILFATREARSGRSAPLTERYGGVWMRIFWNLEPMTEVLPEVELMRVLFYRRSQERL